MSSWPSRVDSPMSSWQSKHLFASARTAAKTRPFAVRVLAVRVLAIKFVWSCCSRPEVRLRLLGVPEAATIPCSLYWHSLWWAVCRYCFENVAPQCRYLHLNEPLPIFCNQRNATTAARSKRRAGRIHQLCCLPQSTCHSAYKNHLKSGICESSRPSS